MRVHPQACDPNGHLQESLGPPGPKSPKSLKKVSPGLPARSVQKSRKESKCLKKVSKRDFSETFLRLFDSDFLDTPGREARGDFFETFWGFRAPRRGPETPVNGRSGRNPRLSEEGRGSKKVLNKWLWPVPPLN